MAKKYIVTAFGKDRTGIVADVSQVLYEYGCNLEDTRMANLSGDFSLLILFTSPEDNDIETKLSEAYGRFESERGISAYIRPVSGQLSKPTASLVNHTLTVEGLDHTGIVFRISRYLADQRVNIENLDSSVTHTPESGAAVYHMRIQIQVPTETSMLDLETGLNQLAEELHVEITIDQR